MLPSFYTFPEFSDVTDIAYPQPPPTAPPDKITDQGVGYLSNDPPSHDPGPNPQRAKVWTRRATMPVDKVRVDDLSAFPTTVPAVSYSQALGVNSVSPRSQIVGWVSAVPNEAHSCVFEHTQRTLLIGLDGTAGQLQGGAQGQARGVTDDLGSQIHVAGWVTDPQQGFHRPVRWTLPLDANGVVVAAGQVCAPLSPMEGEAHRVHNNGMIAGWHLDPTGNMRAFRWSPNVGLKELGTLGGARSVGLGVAADGSVVGWSDTAMGETHGFHWREGTTGGIPSNPEMKDLGSWAGSSVANDINDAGVIVGSSLAPSGTERACVWTVGGMYDLNALLYPWPLWLIKLILAPATFWALARANAINERWEIVGRGRDGTGKQGGWLFRFEPQLSGWVKMIERWRRLLHWPPRPGPPPPPLRGPAQGTA